VHQEVRAFLSSSLSPNAYYEAAVRPKKRKELRRLAARLGELGPVVHEVLADGALLDQWATIYLQLELAGWKGRAGTALACDAAGEGFFRQVVRFAWDAGRLQFRRLRVGERTIAMLVNFITVPGSFSFKTVFDEDYARFSPGVLVQIENLELLERSDVDWMDSCAVEDHPMIDSLWMERRTIVRCSVPLSGLTRRATFSACRTLERLSQGVRQMGHRR
jgi:CelD/BcsL family acetyltransferase involved in cellulose biosynthesis